MSDTKEEGAAPKLLPPDIMDKLRNADASAQKFHHDEARRLREMSDDELLETTRITMRNLDQVDEGADRTLRAVLVPECWERIRPGTRDGLRTMLTTLAEWNEEAKSRLTLAIRNHLGPEGVDRIRGESARLKAEIEDAAKADALGLVEKMLFLISGSHAYEGKGRLPTDPVYEPAFAYRLVPEIARRMLERAGQQRS